MSYDHKISVEIINNSSKTLYFNKSWFDWGGLADGDSFPNTINSHGDIAIVHCHESFFTGCSGYVSYSTGGSNKITLYFSFANEILAANKVDVGLNSTVWDNMTEHTIPVERIFIIQSTQGEYLSIVISSTKGSTNHAKWIINDVDTSKILPENPKLASALSTYNKINVNGIRSYYDVHADFKYLLSHFKGVGSYKNKLLFTHSNITNSTIKEKINYLKETLPGEVATETIEALIDYLSEVLGIDLPNLDDIPEIPLDNGLYLIGDKITKPDTAVIEATFKTIHTPKWSHPGGFQVCGSYMAMGLQATDHSNTSEIQIYDIRMTAINQPMTLLAKIDRNDGINGVAMTKEADKNGGRYLVAGINGTTLTISRSRTSTMDAHIVFDTIHTETNFPENGPGLALVTETEGDIYLFTMHGSDGGAPCTMNLYKIELSYDNKKDVTSCKVITDPSQRPAQKNMNIPGISDSVKEVGDELLSIGGTILAAKFGIGAYAVIKIVFEIYGKENLNTNFRWGKGMAINSSDAIEIYATDRNMLPLIGSGKNFSVVTWKSKP